MIRKVLDRDGKVLEEFDKAKNTTRVTSEYVAGTMVEMMQGVVKGGGTAPGANAAGHQLAGKTGTVNDQTDVWFVGYTPTYVTGVWMGNPLKKENLGSGMTGGRGALPYFNAFMGEFMKDKPKDKFYETPPMTSDIKALAEQRKRDELEKLERDAEAGRRLGVNYNPPKITSESLQKEVENAEKGITNPATTVIPDDEAPPPVQRERADDLSQVIRDVVTKPFTLQQIRESVSDAAQQDPLAGADKLC